MTLETVLVLFGVLVAAVSFFIPAAHKFEALAAAILLIGIGVLVGGPVTLG